MHAARTVATLACLAAAGWAQPTKITTIRSWTQSDATRVVVEFSDEFTYRYGRLSNPDRVYFDVPESILQLDSAPGKRFATATIEGALVKQVRAAESKPGTVRLVFDVGVEGASFTVSELANPPRLVVEFRGGPAEAVAPPPTPTPSVRQPRPQPPPAAIPQISLDQMRRGASDAASGKVQKPPATAAVPLSTVPSLAAKPDTSAALIPVPPTLAPPPQVTALPALRASRSMTRALGLKLGRIVIDPGHGGTDLGTTSASGLHEKDLVLDVAKRLGEILTATLGTEVAYTRTSDTFVPLEQRTAFANAQRADLFLSIHANHSRLKNISGPETFYLNFSPSPDAMEVAARENATSGHTVFELQDLLKKIALNEKVSESRDFAAKVQSGMMELASAKAKKLRDRGVKRAPFVVLIGAAMPSVLAEIGFLSSPREEALLKKADYRQQVAEALAKGITGYAETLSRLDMASAKASAADTQ